MTENKHAVARSFGVLFALALAGLLVTLSVSAMNPGNSFGGIVLIFALMFIGGPLLLATVGITIYLAIKGAMRPGLAALMWVPIVIGLAIIPVSDYLISKNLMQKPPSSQGAGHASNGYRGSVDVVAGRS